MIFSQLFEGTATQAIDAGVPNVKEIGGGRFENDAARVQTNPRSRS